MATLTISIPNATLNAVQQATVQAAVQAAIASNLIDQPLTYVWS